MVEKLENQSDVIFIHPQSNLWTMEIHFQF